MAGLSLRRLAVGAAAILWLLAAWHAWVARGLYLDGAAALVTMLKNGGFALFYQSRLYMMALTQAPAAAAMGLGVTDTRVIAQLYSAGLFLVPTAFYHAALWRARNDAALLTAVLVAIGVVFLPTSFFIIGESNAIDAAVIFCAVVLATARRPAPVDGLLLAATAALLIRSYETVSCFGLLLAAFAAWRLGRGGGNGAGVASYALAILAFLAASAVSIYSLFDPTNPAPLGDALNRVVQFWRNLQFILPLLALVIVAAFGRGGGKSAVLAAMLLLVFVAVSPLLLLVDIGVAPLPRTHYHSRTVAGLVIAALAIAIWLHAWRPSWTPRPVHTALAAAALLAALPPDIVLTELWRRSLVEFRTVISTHTGLIAAEETAFLHRPYSEMVEPWALPSQSVILRRKPTDGIILPPKGYAGWQPFDATKPLPAPFAKFHWED
ncbi:MAG TPA: hypothetical protein VMI56_06640 [Reyranella sp.]|nr:hypothetical protein [Reyranella sp.]